MINRYDATSSYNSGLICQVSSSESKIQNKQTTIIFNKSLESGSVPKDWRAANVCPTYKKGKRTSPENYRPVTLTSQICKLFEHIVRQDLVQHLELNHFISDTQHGFRKECSCLTTLLVFLDEVAAAVNIGNCIDAIYLDFAKAFDKVPHQRLIQKLRTHGISGAVLRSISSVTENKECRSLELNRNGLK